MRILRVLTQMFPVSRYIDQGRNPQLYTKECLERALAKNEQVKGKIDTMKVSEAPGGGGGAMAAGKPSLQSALRPSASSSSTRSETPAVPQRCPAGPRGRLASGKVPVSVGVERSRRPPVTALIVRTCTPALPGGPFPGTGSFGLEGSWTFVPFCRF